MNFSNISITQAIVARMKRSEIRGLTARLLPCSRISLRFIRATLYLSFKNVRVIATMFAFLLSTAFLPAFASSLYPLDNAKQEAQFNHLLKELRCLVCQNQDLADSNAELAKDLRGEVYQLVREGKSDHEITTYLTERYGDFILFKPPVKGITSLLWFGPALFLIIGLVIFWRACLQRREE